MGKERTDMEWAERWNVDYRKNIHQPSRLLVKEKFSSTWLVGNQHTANVCVWLVTYFMWSAHIWHYKESLKKSPHSPATLKTIGRPQTTSPKHVFSNKHPQFSDHVQLCTFGEEEQICWYLKRATSQNRLIWDIYNQSGIFLHDPWNCGFYKKISQLYVFFSYSNNFSIGINKMASSYSEDQNENASIVTKKTSKDHVNHHKHFPSINSSPLNRHMISIG